MNAFHRSELTPTQLPGRAIQKAVGQGSYSSSQAMTVGFAHYSAESGLMQPHQHAEETVFIVDAENGWVEFGQERERLDRRLPLAKGMILHIPEKEWHVFRYERGGFVDILFIYGGSDDIRPEETLSGKQVGNA